MKSRERTVFYLRHLRTCGALWSTHRLRNTCLSSGCLYGSPSRSRSSLWPTYNPGHLFERVRPGRPWQRSVHRRVPITSHLTLTHYLLTIWGCFHTKSRQFWVNKGFMSWLISQTKFLHAAAPWSLLTSLSHTRTHTRRQTAGFGERRGKKKPHTPHTGPSVTWLWRHSKHGSSQSLSIRT